MKTVTKKLFGLIALAVIITFSFVSCEPEPDDTGEPTLTVSAVGISSSDIQVYWNEIPGALGYNVYNGTSSNPDLLDLRGYTLDTAILNNNLPAGTRVYYQVVAFAASGTILAKGTANATTLAANNYSLNGVWQSGGWEITVTGSSGVISKMNSSTVPLYQDAESKGYYKVGTTYWRNLTSKSSTTWSGQTLGITFNDSNPNVATGTGWFDNVTFTLSNNGQTLTVGSSTWTRVSGSWE